MTNIPDSSSIRKQSAHPCKSAIAAIRSAPLGAAFIGSALATTSIESHGTSAAKAFSGAASDGTAAIAIVRSEEEPQAKNKMAGSENAMRRTAHRNKARGTG